MEQALLEVKNLTTSFKIRKQWVTAVEDVSFYVKKRETLGIVGESGCGKSVTSMSILHLLPRASSRLDRGEILYNGNDISKLSDKEMSKIRGREISMIFQDSMTSLNPVQNIETQLMEAVILHQSPGREEAKKRVMDLLLKVGMPSTEKRLKEYPHQLSGGMRQRVMIAMALAQNPSLIIADEPTTALDVTIQAQIMELLKELKEKTDASIMLITHDLGVVADMADKIMVMYAGMIMEYGTTEEIFKNPFHPYTKGLLASIPRKDKDIERLYTIEGTVPTLQDMPKGCRFCTRCKDADERCWKERPDMYEIGERRVKCFKYENYKEGKQNE